MSDGEVAVRQNGTTTAIDAPGLDGQINIDLDDSTPHVGVPTDADVRFEDVDESEDDARTDGGIAKRVDLRTEGYALGEELAIWSMIVGGFALVAGGYLFGLEGAGVAGIVSMAAGGILTYLGAVSYGGGEVA